MLIALYKKLKEDPEREAQEDYRVYSLIREETPHQKPFDQAYEDVHGHELEY